jgi:hypothetical protein
VNTTDGSFFLPANSFIPAAIGNVTSLPGVSDHEKVWISVEPQGDFGAWGNGQRHEQRHAESDDDRAECTSLVPHDSIR